MSSAPLLDVSSLSVAQGGAALLRDISLSLREEECLAVVGPNGAGKTTLLRAMAGLVAPSRGTVKLQGQEASRLTAEHRSHLVGLVPQRLAHIPPFTVREFLELSGLERGQESLSLVQHLEDPQLNQFLLHQK